MFVYFLYSGIWQWNIKFHNPAFKCILEQCYCFSFNQTYSIYSSYYLDVPKKPIPSEVTIHNHQQPTVFLGHDGMQYLAYSAPTNRTISQPSTLPISESNIVIVPLQNGQISNSRYSATTQPVPTPILLPGPQLSLAHRPLIIHQTPLSSPNLTMPIPRLSSLSVQPITKTTNTMTSVLPQPPAHVSANKSKVLENIFWLVVFHASGIIQKVLLGCWLFLWYTCRNSFLQNLYPKRYESVCESSKTEIVCWLTATLTSSSL